MKMINVSLNMFLEVMNVCLESIVTKCCNYCCGIVSVLLLLQENSKNHFI